jgi:hypothetical protein
MATLLIASDALAMSACTIAADTICVSQRPPQASQALKAWLKSLCDDAGRCQPGVPADLPAFVKGISANTQFWRQRCGGQP